MGIHRPPRWQRFSSLRSSSSSGGSVSDTLAKGSKQQQQQDLAASSVSPREGGVVPSSPSPETSGRQGGEEYSITQGEGGASLAAAEGTKLWDVLMGLKKGRRGIKPQPFTLTDGNPRPAVVLPTACEGGAVGDPEGDDVTSRKRALELAMCPVGSSSGGSYDDEGAAGVG